MSKAYLILQSGETYQGKWHGDPDLVQIGEVVFNTSHSGYEEMATDPSYFRQILVSTASHQGNYGVSDDFWESSNIHIRGFVCLQIQSSKRESSWIQRLNESGVPVLSDFDTRSLILRLREGGTALGALLLAETEAEAKKHAQKLFVDFESENNQADWTFEVSRKELSDFEGSVENGPKVAVLDFGCKNNIIRELQKRCSSVRIFPGRTPAAEILKWKPDGLVLSNGPGDPSSVQVAVGTIKELLGKIPMFGICMGHQLLGLALGGKTYRLKFGHRGGNHPIKDELLNRIYVTSQNHGYAVAEESLPPEVQITHRNLNDQSVSGIYWPQKKIFAVQFHPESHPGPHEGESLFDFFVEQLR